MNERNHHVDSIVVNLCHIWQCRDCGERWNPGEHPWLYACPARSEDAKTLIDEDPRAYKDIDAVMAAQTDLVTVAHTLRQVLNYKGA